MTMEGSTTSSVLHAVWGCPVKVHDTTYSCNWQVRSICIKSAWYVIKHSSYLGVGGNGRWRIKSDWNCSQLRPFVPLHFQGLTVIWIIFPAASVSVLTLAPNIERLTEMSHLNWCVKVGAWEHDGVYKRLMLWLCSPATRLFTFPSKCER